MRVLGFVLIIIVVVFFIYYQFYHHHENSYYDREQAKIDKTIKTVQAQLDKMLPLKLDVHLQMTKISLTKTDFTFEYKVVEAPMDNMDYTAFEKAVISHSVMDKKQFCDSIFALEKSLPDFPNIYNINYVLNYNYKGKIVTTRLTRAFCTQ